MKHILFPTDFSDNSEKALPFAAEIAKIFDAELTIFNSYKLPYSKSNLLVSITDRMRQDSLEGLKEYEQRLKNSDDYKSLKIKTDSRIGSFVPWIPKIARDCSSNLIVMGTKGASSLKEMMIGSNTLEVIQVTKCPVLAVPEKATLGKVKKIAMATDLLKVNHEKTLSPLFELARAAKASIEFVNISRKQDEGFSEEKAKQAAILENLAEDIPTSIHMSTNEDIIDGLSEYIYEHQPGLIAMLARKHSLFERIFQRSITTKLAFRSEIPLLVMDE